MLLVWDETKLSEEELETFLYYVSSSVKVGAILVVEQLQLAHIFLSGQSKKPVCGGKWKGIFSKQICYDCLLKDITLKKNRNHMQLQNLISPLYEKPFPLNTSDHQFCLKPLKLRRNSIVDVNFVSWIVSSSL